MTRSKGMATERHRTTMGRTIGKVQHRPIVRKGITATSRWAEKRVMRHVNGTLPSDRNICDVVIPLIKPINGNTEIRVEVKSKISRNIYKVTNYTANQIRPFKYNVLVIVTQNMPAFGCDCLVFSALDVLRKALPNSGQHTQDSMVCCNFSVSPRDVAKFGCSYKNLRGRIIDAFIEDYVSDKGEFAKYEIARRKREYALMCENNKILAGLLNK